MKKDGWIKKCLKWLLEKCLAAVLPAVLAGIILLFIGKCWVDEKVDSIENRVKEIDVSFRKYKLNMQNILGDAVAGDKISGNKTGLEMKNSKGIQVGRDVAGDVVVRDKVVKLVPQKKLLPQKCEIEPVFEIVPNINYHIDKRKDLKFSIKNNSKYDAEDVTMIIIITKPEKGWGSWRDGVSSFEGKKGQFNAKLVYSKTVNGFRQGLTIHDVDEVDLLASIVARGVPRCSWQIELFRKKGTDTYTEKRKILRKILKEKAQK